MIRIDHPLPSEPIVRIRVSRQLLGRATYSAAAYWVDGLLIDTGCARTSHLFAQAVTSLGVDQVVNTHSHEDHIGANASVQALTHCPILAHPAALPILENPRLQPLQPYRRFFWGWPRPSQGTPIGTEIVTDRHRFQVIPTPGHSPDHICLFEPDRGWLFSGDAFIGGQDRALRRDNDIRGILASLKTLSALPIQVLLAGSGTVRTEGVRPILDKIAYLEELGERIAELQAQGLGPRRIRRRLLGRELPITYLTLGHFSGLHLVRSYLAEPQREPAPDDDVPSSP